MACVAAIIVSTTACSSNGGERKAVIDFTLHEEGVDNLTSNATPEETPQMAAVAQIVGLPHIYSPNKPAFDKGIMGVAPLGTDCIVIFTKDPKSSVNDATVGTTIQGRYNTSTFVLGGARKLDRIKEFIDRWAPACGRPSATV